MGIYKDPNQLIVTINFHHPPLLPYFSIHLLALPTKRPASHTRRAVHTRLMPGIDYVVLIATRLIHVAETWVPNFLARATWTTKSYEIVDSGKVPHRYENRMRQREIYNRCRSYEVFPSDQEEQTLGVWPQHIAWNSIWSDNQIPESSSICKSRINRIG